MIVAEEVYVNATEVSANGYKEIDVKFAKEYKSLISVFATLATGSDSSAYGDITVVTVPGTATTTGVKIRLYNKDSSTRVPAVKVTVLGYQ